jgi:VWFA-related protein
MATVAIDAVLPALADEPADRFRESVTAERIVVDVHVIDNTGNPITGLTASDFALRVDGRPAAIESVEWIVTGAPVLAPLPESAAEAIPVERSPDRSVALPGRLVVLFFQTDYELSRLTGQMRMIREALAILETFSPEDRVAVLSYDSRLKLRQDFTGDREKLRRAIRRTIYTDNAPDPPAGPFPSLAASLDYNAARRASLPEHALRVIGQALAALPGSKSLLFFGWGIGNFDPIMGLILDHNYGPARSALVRSHTSVFVLDVTSADFHSMEGGLEAIAGDTGGLYLKTHIFPKFAMQKVVRAISGYYLLTFARPPLRRGRHEMSIRIAGHPQASVLARPDYQD